MRPRRLRRRVLFAGVTALALGGALGSAWIRGSHAGPEPAGPTSAAAGTRVALCLAPGDRSLVWCSRDLPAALPAVWTVITDYAAFARMFPGMAALTATPGEGGTVELRGRLSILGQDLPLEATVVHEPGVDRARVRWDSPSSALPVNRGSWTLEGLEGATRVTYRLDLELAGTPSWMTRAYLLRQVPVGVEALGAEVTRRAGGTP